MNGSKYSAIGSALATWVVNRQHLPRNQALGLSLANNNFHWLTASHWALKSFLAAIDEAPLPFTM
jgi:hypothetical protein